MAEVIQQERRRAPRVRIQAGVPSRMYSAVEARLLELSVVGALLEHTEPVRPGYSCEMVIEGNLEEPPLQCRIVRSVLTRQAQGGRGSEVCYHSGVEFVGPTPAQATLLEVLIRRNSRGGGGGKPPAGPHVLLLI